jgi:adenylate cyclase
VAASYAWLGDKTAAAAHFARIHVLNPEFDVEAYLATLHYKEESDLQHHREGLLKAGFGG